MTEPIQIEIGERVLANGLTLLAVRNPGVSTFAASVALRVGRVEEGPAEHGLAYLVGECLDEGTARHSSVELAEVVEGIGGYMTCAANGVTIQCPATDRAKAIRVLREVALEPSFPQREVRRVQQEVLAEVESERGEAQVCASRRFRKEVYGQHPLGRPDYGSVESVAGFRPAELRRFHRKWFVPSCGYVAAAGPVDIEETLDLLAKVFRSFRGGTPEHPTPTIAELPDARRDVHLAMKREQVHLYFGHRGVRRADPDFYALLVMDHVLGSGPGFTSRICRKLRDELGLCYSVYASITSGAGVHPSCFQAYIGTSAQHRKRAVDGFLEEVGRIRETLPTAAELEAVRDYLTGSFAFALERNMNLINYAVRCKRFKLGFDYLQRYPQLIRGVTREDVRRVAAQHLSPDRAVTVSAGAG